MIWKLSLIVYFLVHRPNPHQGGTVDAAQSVVRDVYMETFYIGVGLER